MTNSDFTLIVNSTKSVVLSAIEKNLAERFYYAIDDVVQETYLRAYKSLTKGNFRYEAKISTWLYTIARNESLRMNDKLIREEKKIEKATSQIKEERPIEEEVEENPKKVNLLDYLKMIPDKYKEILEHYINGLSEKEIADRLSIKQGTVKSRTSRGKEFLRKIILMGERNE
ncbi:MAG TPA: RNA polymerase sigma factor [Leptospiraceae bacterium]|nr:RNA polymerase sigma factor [Leptospiraceae bacterium]HMW04571.1 RNA polymerase sigma factor [Leptospiraceae bacterium]HMX33276.1 RNA polymerase sigma factor [Leptospiraceae bacterium]HMY30757.1 RNA polymerase sigma factor [Leptospiraceae bacterium]HMZ64335.1 RNA polymerase sigma factor [Leptospiraceae bacterium]